MEHNTDRILWTVLALAIGVALYVGFRPAANGLLSQGVEKIQDVVTNVNGNTSDSSPSNSHTAVGDNLLTGTHADWQNQNAGGWSTGDAITVNVEKNTEYTAQAEIKSDVNTDTWHVEVWGFPNNSTSDKFLGWNQETHVNGGISKVTFNSGNYTRVQINPHVSTTDSPKSKMVYWRHEKLEKGPNSTDWTN